MYRWATLAAFLVGWLAVPALGADEKASPPSEPKVLERLVQRFSLVVQKDVEEKLNLSDEQKAKLERIQKELDGKNQKLLVKAMLKLADLQDALDKAKNDDAEDLKTSALDIGMLTLELIKTQREIDAKFRDILTDEQKKVYQQLKGTTRPRR